MEFLLWLSALLVLNYAFYGCCLRAKGKCIPFFHRWSDWSSPYSEFVALDAYDGGVVEQLWRERTCDICHHLQERRWK